MASPSFIPDATQTEDSKPVTVPEFIPDAMPQVDPHPRAFDDPRVGQVGYYINGDQNVVIAPKEGENYLDTIKRAVEHNAAMSGQQRDEAVGREMSGAGKKVATTLVMAPAIGAGGSAMLAAPGEIHSLLNAGVKALLPALTNGVKGIGEWAAANPMAARVIFNGLKWAVQGSAAGTAMKVLGKVIDAAPSNE